MKLSPLQNDRAARVLVTLTARETPSALATNSAARFPTEPR